MAEKKDKKVEDTTGGGAKADYKASHEKLTAAYQAAKKAGTEAEWLAAHPSYAKGIGKGPAKPDPDKVPPAENTTAETQQVLNEGMAYGKTSVDELIPVGSFPKVDPATSAAMTAYLDKLDAWQKEASNLTPDEKAAVDNLRAGLAGYEAPEVQGMRESAQQEINRQYAGQLAALKTQTARQVGMGRAGGAAFAQTQDVLAQKRGVEGNLERDLLVKNADEVQKRKQAFADTVRASEDSRFGRTSQAMGLYANTLSSVDATKMQAEQFNATQGSNEATARGSTIASLAGTFAGTQQANKSAAEAQAFRLWQEAEAKRQRKWQMKLAKKGFASQEKIAQTTADAVKSA